MRGAKTEENQGKNNHGGSKRYPKEGQISEGRSFNGKVRLLGSTKRSFRVP